MGFSAALFDQARMLHKNDRTNFSVFQHPIYEITGKTLGMVGGSGTIGTAVADVALSVRIIYYVYLNLKSTLFFKASAQNFILIVNLSLG